MNIEITARHFTASHKLKELIYEKIKKIKKFNSSIMNCHVILTKENNSENVEIVAHAKGYDFAENENEPMPFRIHFAGFNFRQEIIL